MAKLTFYGAARWVTGSNFILEHYDSGDRTRIMIDCGMMQGLHAEEGVNLEAFAYDPSAVDALFVTHAHLDHIGRIPRLMKFGFKGPIYSTPQTKEIAELLLRDSYSINRHEVKDKDDLIFTEEHLELALAAWRTVEYHKPVVMNGLTITLKDAGHILGSAMVEIAGRHGNIVFTGDLGNVPNPVIRDTEPLTGANYLVIESTYGDRERETADPESELKAVIEETIKRSGVLLIPAFSVERTQKLLFHLNELADEGRIPRVPVFLDSPLAIKVTEVYRRNRGLFCDEAKKILATDQELFKFPGLVITPTTEESKKINDVPPPKVIIAGSGMSTGGRIMHHELRYLGDPRSTLLLIGYQAVGTLGRAVQDGAKWVRIFGEEVAVAAHVRTLHGYSAHPDANGLVDFVEQSVESLKHVYMVHGEPKAGLFFAQRVRDWLGVPASVPFIGETIEVVV